MREQTGNCIGNCAKKGARPVWTAPSRRKNKTNYLPPAFRNRKRIQTERTPAKRAEQGKFSHRPVSPIGQRITMTSNGKTKATEREMAAANAGRSTADIKLWVAKESQRVM